MYSTLLLLSKPVHDYLVIHNASTTRQHAKSRTKTANSRISQSPPHQAGCVRFWRR